MVRKGRFKLYGRMNLILYSKQQKHEDDIGLSYMFLIRIPNVQDATREGPNLH